MRNSAKRWLPLIVCLALAAGPVRSQAPVSPAYPSMPLYLVIPTSAGSTMDILARLVAQKVAESVNQPVVSEVRPGANGIIGANVVAKAAPDGYRFMIAASATLIASPYIYKSLPFDPRRDFTPISLAAEAITCLAVHTSLPVNSVQELIDYMKRYPKKVAFGSSGIGSSFHLIAEMLRQHTGVEFIHAPYKGAAPMVQDAVAGQVQMIFSSVTGVMPYLSGGKLRILAMMVNSRYAGMPGVPSIAEIYPSLVRPDGWFGFIGPAGMPQPILVRLNAEIVKALTAADSKAKIDALGMNVVANSPQEFADIYMGGFDKYEKIVKAVGLKPVQ